MLAPILSLLSYVPFEWVAKATLAMCAFLFVADPFPPLSRLVSFISLVVVSGLTRLYKAHNKVSSDVGAVTIVDSNNNSNDNSSNNNSTSSVAESSEMPVHQKDD